MVRRVTSSEQLLSAPILAAAWDPSETKLPGGGAGTPQHGLSSKKIALIPSDYAIMCSLSIK